MNLSPRASTAAALDAVVNAIERTPEAVAARSRAILAIAAAEPEGSDRAAAQHAAVHECALAAVLVLERDPALAELVTTLALTKYIFASACAVAAGGSWSVQLDLRDPHTN